MMKHSMKSRIRASALGVLGLVSGVFGACGTDPGPTVDSSTHWLSSCQVDDDCLGMACSCGICTPVCDASYACAGLGSDATCVLPSSLGVEHVCGEAIPEAICLPTCLADVDCGDPGLSCVLGYCEPTPLAPCAETPVAPQLACLDGQTPAPICVRDADGAYHTTWSACPDDRVPCTSDTACTEEGYTCNVDEVCGLSPEVPESDLVCTGWCVVATSQPCESDATCTIGDICEAGVCTDASCAPDEPTVCGDDGATYESSCVARAMHVTVRHEGPCGAPECDEERCGVAPSVAPCSDGSSREVSCEPDPSGLCRWYVGTCEPVFCTEEWAPMCGVDGVTYANTCFLEQAGVALDHEGECVCSEEDCGPLAVTPMCDEGTAVTAPQCLPDPNGGCAWDYGSCGEPVSCDDDAACPDLQICERGVCEESYCLSSWEPVCGADLVTYTNACEARRAHVEVVASVACDARCADNSACAEGLVCMANGECGPPCAITCLVPDPVCGADGVTYPCGVTDAACYGIHETTPGACE